MPTFHPPGNTDTQPLRSKLRLLAGFTKVGAVCYGGGVLSIASLRKALVDKGVISKKAFEDGLTLSNAVPGFILTNLAVFAGIRSAGAFAAIAAIVGAVLPASLMMVAATQIFLHFREVPAVKAALLSVQPVTLGMLVVMIIRLAPRSLMSWNQAGIAASAALAILVFKVHPSILLAVVAGSSLLLSWVRSGTVALPVEVPPGTVYLAVKRLPRLVDVQVRCYVFVAIDSASCWISIGVGRSNTPEAALAFVASLRTLAPFKVTTLIIGKQVPFASAGAQHVPAANGFSGTCRSMGIHVHFAGQGVAPPHLRIEQFNQRFKQVLKRQHLQPFSRVGQSLQRYAWLHNECLPQRAPLAATPLEILQQWRAIRPQLFGRRPERRLAPTMG